ncbi:acyl-CoA dehydrogenase family protein [Kitasatospora saccharophila]|uniref:Acyl-CoA dehydrogenase family protein n=1 Tax=Kitasatospora saccharophila TaxID=407973 RepID=A0ABN2XAW0_9ACTN
MTGRNGGTPESVERAAAAAAAASSSVDGQARFPAEATAALRAGGLLNAAVPTRLGGLGLPLPELVRIAGRLAAACGSAAMVWSMHQVQMACLARHHPDAPLLARAIAEQWLVASVTSENGVGGDLRSSRTGIGTGEGRCTLDKQGPTVSYGAHADAFLVTARRSADAAPGDQVAVFVSREQSDLRQTGEWNTLGMRGTCSPSFDLRAEFDPAQVLPVPFGDVAARTMVPLSHLLWSGVWVGLAAEAVDRAVRATRRRSRGGPLADRPELAVAHARLAGIRAQLDAATRSAEPVLEHGGQPTMGLAVELNALKVGVSETALDVARLALAVCGMAGFSEDGPHSVARILRDLFSAPLMIGNGRLLAANSQMMLLSGGAR